MTERQVTTKAELLANIERTWTSLNTMLERLAETQMTTLKDAQGWTIKDHLIHLTAWERSVVYFLQGKPRHAGLGVDEGLYLKGSDDDINAIIFQVHKGLPLSDALTQFRHVHHQLMKLLQPLSDEDLQEPYRRYLPDEPGEGNGPPALNVVYGNTAHHFAEHQGWIESLVNETLG
jgi:hypothetical protein